MIQICPVISTFPSLLRFCFSGQHPKEREKKIIQYRKTWGYWKECKSLGKIKVAGLLTNQRSRNEHCQTLC